MPQPDNTVLMEDVHLIYRNFAGRKSTFNAEGDRNFAVLLDERTAEVLSTDGWNVKLRQPREDDEEGVAVPFLPVALKFDPPPPIQPPRVVLITSRGRTYLDEGLVDMLDSADIIAVDLIVNPYHYNVNGKAGIKAYVRSMYITIQEDPLDIKYSELPASP
jgi:hypothetical protein